MKYAQSHQQRTTLILAAFLLSAATIWLDKKVFHQKLLRPPAVAVKIADVNDWSKYNQRIFSVVKVVDGDTIDINISDGNFATTRIRLLGVDTPETKNPYTEVMYFGPQASKFTTDVVLGEDVLIIMDEKSKPRDKYNRLLAHIRLSDGKILNEELISQGFAYADPRFPHSYKKKYIQLEKAAKKEKKGLWEKVKSGQMPQWRQ